MPCHPKQTRNQCVLARMRIMIMMILVVIVVVVVLLLLLLLVVVVVVVVVEMIMNLICVAEFDTNGILTVLYIVIQFIQMHYTHNYFFMRERSLSYTHTDLHIHTRLRKGAHMNMKCSRSVFTALLLYLTFHRNCQHNVRL